MGVGKLVIQAFLAALITMIIIYVWKKIFIKYNVPFLSTVAQEV